MSLILREFSRHWIATTHFAQAFALLSGEHALQTSEAPQEPD